MRLYELSSCCFITESAELHVEIKIVLPFDKLKIHMGVRAFVKTNLCYTSAIVLGLLAFGGAVKCSILFLLFLFLRWP